MYPRSAGNRMPPQLRAHLPTTLACIQTSYPASRLIFRLTRDQEVWFESTMPPEGGDTIERKGTRNHLMSLQGGGRQDTAPRTTPLPPTA